ncbi:MAG: hypothetical protein HYV03_05670 [Deltaproteobacteria bacterium]|nr:hypothetical protein [Deltaproteobacteria bacterium]
MPGLSITMDQRLFRRFGQVCRRHGYQKKGVLLRMIRGFVTHDALAARKRRGWPDTQRDPLDRIIGSLVPMRPMSAKAIDAMLYGRR